MTLNYFPFKLVARGGSMHLSNSQRHHTCQLYQPYLHGAPAPLRPSTPQANSACMYLSISSRTVCDLIQLGTERVSRVLF